MSQGLPDLYGLPFTLLGLAEYAGAIPMDQRQDALVITSLIIKNIKVSCSCHYSRQIVR
ncbi:hypothetical protein [Virgibacillus proomii]|uniref:hypothetical protein n=1 Tax=Virgibacillus proomii TaxID=84407 RepID=UPI0015C31C07|nr:hypothetical protein [Virgibacillus proomii]